MGVELGERQGGIGAIEFHSNSTPDTNSPSLNEPAGRKCESKPWQISYVWTGEDLREQLIQPPNFPGLVKVWEVCVFRTKDISAHLCLFSENHIPVVQTRWTACYNSTVTADSSRHANSRGGSLGLGTCGLSPWVRNPLPRAARKQSGRPALRALPCWVCSPPPFDVRTTIYLTTLSFALCDKKSL